ncbi:MAG: D-aminoacylase [Flammeovirgaceae bacterium]|nr:D-aminoacylase [Flammeovirgaceae bacterium]
MRSTLLVFASLLFITCQERQTTLYDVIIRNGMIYDGSGSKPFRGDMALQADTIAAIGDLSSAKGKKEIDATGLALAPGFINMLSWADGTLLKDGRAMSDIKQGVTLEVFGEGLTAYPVKRKVKGVDSLWTSLDGYYKWLMKKGINPNVASFVGATTIRMHEIGNENRAATPDELNRMKSLVKQAMEEGAMGLGTSLIYAPAIYASTTELIELSKTAQQYGGSYITHMRSESDLILEALDEALKIGREASIPVEIYHLKINHSRNWNKIDTILNKIDSAQKAGLKVTANMYPYMASATDLAERVPKWAMAGSFKTVKKRFANAEQRRKIIHEMQVGFPQKNSDPANVMLLGFRNDSLHRLYQGKRLDEVARLHGKDADETVLDLLVKDRSKKTAAVYFLQSEENVKRMMKLPFVSFGSDAGAPATEKPFTDQGIHPRAYGTFSRVLGRFVRDEKILSLQEAIRRMTSLPASNLKLKARGALKTGYFADVVIFNPDLIQDHATYEKPHQYATGVEHVFVNGVHVLNKGEHTGAKPGRAIRGPGYIPKN